LQIVEKKLPGLQAALYKNLKKKLKILILSKDLSEEEKEVIIKEVKNKNTDSWQQPDQLRIKECGRND
jgi:hypothetical protein